MRRTSHFASCGRRGRVLLTICLAATACGDDGPTGPPASIGTAVLVLNSTGQTLAAFDVVDDVILPGGSPVDLGAGFDGDGFAVSGSLAASSVSSFGGSRIVLVDLEAGTVQQAQFSGPDAALVNPSRATFDEGDSVWIGGRGTDAVYRLDPGAVEATLVAADVGSFVERVIPDGSELYALDANLDDVGLTYAPLGPGRIVVLDRLGAGKAVIDLPAVAPNPSDAVLAGGRLIVLAGGTFDPVNFAPNSDGALITVDPAARQVISTHRLEANGVRLAFGADGQVYVTTTSDYLSLDLLRFDPATGDFSRGPEDPIPTTDAIGATVDCWTATALADGRIICATFRTDAPGRLLLLGPDGDWRSETQAGFGTTDIRIRR